MKNTFKYLSAIALSSMVCLSLALPASAQRNGNSGGGGSRPSSGGGGGGGGYHPSGGSSGGFRPSTSSGNSYRPSTNSGSSYRPSTSSGNSAGSYRPSNGGGNYRPSVGIARPSYGGGSYRPSVNNPRVAIAPPRVNSQGIRPPMNRIGVNTPNASGYRGYVSPNGSNVIGNRGYVGQGGRASVGVGGRGFYPSGYWGEHHYYHYYHGYYDTYYAPRLGFSIGFLPYGYYPFYWDDYQYYYCNGLFYTYDNNEYTVVEPPVGAEVNELPSNAQSIVINGEQYYEANGIYYKPIVKDDGTTSYEVAGKDGQLNTDEQQSNDNYQAPQIGDIVPQLPPDCRKININGEKYFVSPDGYYYEETKDPNGDKVYKIVGTPDDEPDNQ